MSSRVESADAHQRHSVPQHEQKQAKPLRFVTNYGAPHPKRRRVGAACLTCRKRKTACSGERPRCVTCKQTKLECAGYSSETSSVLAPNRATPDHVRPRDHGVNDVDDRASGARASHNAHPLPDIDPSMRSNVPDPIHAVDRGTSHREASNLSQVTTYGKSSDSAGDRNDSLFPRPRDRMPYFRWLGPTAIMPGFKQMVVKVRRDDQDGFGPSSSNGDMIGRPSPGRSDHNPISVGKVPALPNSGEVIPELDPRSIPSLPFYDNSPVPPSELTTHLAETFFTHLGCNYPFLQRKRFLRDLEAKQVDTILVDAVCALAARFSMHPLLTSHTSTTSIAAGSEKHDKQSPAEYGRTFAQRAKTALVDTFACPTVAAVQAALLLAYLEFGESRDSGLWMYLGISIRMAQDLGLHTGEGLKYLGKDDLTPKNIEYESVQSSKDTNEHNDARGQVSQEHASPMASPSETIERTAVHQGRTTNDGDHACDEQKAVEQERIDTFWAVFFLDRVVSSGTGRRSTLRDRDIELPFPSLDNTDPNSGWPAPFPALIRIIHLYGRVADLLNSIKGPLDITADTSKHLAAMESQVTNFYQGLSERLHFDAINFQHYMKAGEGTNFVLLHFWFHTLIVLLHQPTLVKTFEGNMLKLFPNSLQLSMSSAKTIADILSYSQLMDAKASLGNPFTSQPIYIAACAFLKETAGQTSRAQSRATSPSPTKRPHPDSASSSKPQTSATKASMEASGNANSSDPQESASVANTELHTQATTRQNKPALAKHTLLAAAATQHYRLCYKALQSLETYWAGTKYILTILDQKFEGVEDPLLYTEEESELSLEEPRPVPEFKSPGWRRKSGLDVALPGTYLSSAGRVSLNALGGPLWRARTAGDGEASQAIGWTLTGNMNSPSTNLAWHYPSIGPDSGMDQSRSKDGAVSPYTPQLTDRPTGAQQLPRLQQTSESTASIHTSNQQLNPPLSASTMRQQPSGTGMSNLDAADLLLGLNNPYSTFRDVATDGPSFAPSAVATQSDRAAVDSGSPWLVNPMATQHIGDFMIESQDVDMSLLGLDMMPWFESYESVFDHVDLASPGLDSSANAQNDAGSIASAIGGSARDVGRPGE